MPTKPSNRETCSQKCVEFSGFQRRPCQPRWCIASSRTPESSMLPPGALLLKLNFAAYVSRVFWRPHTLDSTFEDCTFHAQRGEALSILATANYWCLKSPGRSKDDILCSRAACVQTPCSCWACCSVQMLTLDDVLCRLNLASFVTTW